MFLLIDLKLKNAVFWDVAPCRFSVNRRFGGTYRLHLQGTKIRERGTSVSMWLLTLVLRSRISSSTPKTEAIRSSETLVYTKSTRRHIAEDGILHSHRRENLKFDLKFTTQLNRTLRKRDRVQRQKTVTPENESFLQVIEGIRQELI
jgi:hypothetical protein